MPTSEIVNELKKLLGEEHVLTTPEDKACYAFDATADMPSHFPDAVLFPGSTEEIQGVMRLASRTKTPVYVRGSGTNLSGGTIPLAFAEMISSTSIDPPLSRIFSTYSGVTPTARMLTSCSALSVFDEACAVENRTGPFRLS